MKPKGLEDGSIPFGQLPLLDIDGVRLAQSATIVRYVGRKCVTVLSDYWETDLTARRAFADLLVIELTPPPLCASG